MDHLLCRCAGLSLEAERLAAQKHSCCRCKCRYPVLAAGCTETESVALVQFNTAWKLNRFTLYLIKHYYPLKYECQKHYKYTKLWVLIELTCERFQFWIILFSLSDQFRRRAGLSFNFCSELSYGKPEVNKRLFPPQPVWNAKHAVFSMNLDCWSAPPLVQNSTS